MHGPRIVDALEVERTLDPMAIVPGVHFVITYGPVDRIWCPICEKAERLPALDADTAKQLEAQHRCGERTTPWASAGLR